MNEPRQVFECRRSKSGDVVQHPVVQEMVDTSKLCAEMAEVQQHAGGRIRSTTDHDRRAIAVAVDSSAGFGLDIAFKGVGCLENEGF